MTQDNTSLAAAVAEALDLDAYEDVQTASLVLKNPVTGAPTAATISIIGPEHPARKKIHFDRARRYRQELQRNGKISATDPLEDIDNDTDYLVTCTTGWTGIVRAGVTVPYSPENARSLFVDPKLQWVRAQVKKAMDETERFISSSAKA